MFDLERTSLGVFWFYGIVVLKIILEVFSKTLYIKYNDK